jgi:hypothetical protein
LPTDDELNARARGPEHGRFPCRSPPGLWRWGEPSRARGRSRAGGRARSRP